MLALLSSGIPCGIRYVAALLRSVLAAVHTTTTSTYTVLGLLSSLRLFSIRRGKRSYTTVTVWGGGLVAWVCGIFNEMSHERRRGTYLHWYRYTVRNARNDSQDPAVELQGCSVSVGCSPFDFLPARNFVGTHPWATRQSWCPRARTIRTRSSSVCGRERRPRTSPIIRLVQTLSGSAIADIEEDFGG